MGSAGSSIGCGGRLVTRTQAAGYGHGGLGSVPSALRSGAACGALHGTPSHLKPRKYEKDLVYRVIS